MFQTTATIDRTSSPVLLDWTTQEVLEWLGQDDARSHDPALLSTLTAIDDGLAARSDTAASALAPHSPAPLVRAIAVRLRVDPALRELRVRDLVGSAR